MLLSTKIPLKIGEIISRMPVEEARYYKLFKENICKRYLLNGEYYRSKWYSLKPESGDSNAEHIRRSRGLLNKWLKAENVQETYADLFEFLLKNQYLRKLPSDKVLFLIEQKLHNLDQIPNFADIYDSAYFWTEHPKSNFKNAQFQFNQNKSTDLNNSNRANYSKQTTSQNDESDKFSNNGFTEKPTCSFCQKRGQTINNCYAKNGKPSFNTQSTRPQPTTTPLENKAKFKKQHQAAAVNIVVSDPKKIFSFREKRT